MPFSSGLDRLDWSCKPQTLSLEEGRVAFSGTERLSSVALIRLRAAEPPAFRFPTEPQEPGSSLPCCGQPAEDQALKPDSAPGMLSPHSDRVGS